VAQRVGRGIALLFHDRSTRRGLVTAFRGIVQNRGQKEHRVAQNNDQ